MKPHYINQKWAKMFCESSKDDLFEKLKKINEDEYRKVIIKKAVDLEFDVSYIPLVALSLALLGIVIANIRTNDENVIFALWLVIGVIGIFSVCTFWAMKLKKDKLLKLVKEIK